MAKANKGKPSELEKTYPDESAAPPIDCVFGCGRVSEVYCDDCENWLCQECYDEHDC